MLVLARRKGQTIILYEKGTNKKIGEIKVDRITPSYVKLAIDLPDSIGVARDEVYETNSTKNG